MPESRDFSKLTFEDFRRLAADESLSKYERIGFPDSYRAGHEGAIFGDIVRKLPQLDGRNCRVLDIGPGCSDLPSMLIEKCRAQGHELDLVDSREMLDRLPDADFVRKTAALFPACPEFLTANRERFDAIVCYSVLHYVFVDTQIFRFLDAALAVLAPGGSMLIGDVPNVSKRKRFFASQTGARFHQQFMNTDQRPSVSFNQLEIDQIDDAVVFGLLMRARAAGFDAYVVPQARDLPMANRREDLLIHRP